ncbi:MAG: hypothetical protein EXR41_04240 [Candidatus Methylopumilus sp.]|nr:hypothetical protein [Candidatus Methylopumilus sp.]
MTEKISTLLDDELDLQSMDQTVSAITRDRGLRARFETYQLIRDSMRNELSDATFSSKSILDAIDKEPIQLQFIKPSKAASTMALPYIPFISWPMAASFIAIILIATVTMNHNYLKPSDSVEIAEEIPADFIKAHQLLAPSNIAYYSEADQR